MIDIVNLLKRSNIVHYQTFLQRNDERLYEIGRFCTNGNGLNDILNSPEEYFNMAYRDYNIKPKDTDSILIQVFNSGGNAKLYNLYTADVEKNFAELIISLRCFHFISIFKDGNIGILTRFIDDDDEYFWTPDTFDVLNKFADKPAYVGRLKNYKENATIIFRSPMYRKSVNDEFPFLHTIYPLEEIEVDVVQTRNNKEYYCGEINCNIHDIEILDVPPSDTLVSFIYGLHAGIIERPRDWHLENLNRKHGNPHKEIDWYKE